MSTRTEYKLYAVYWRNPKTRTFESLPGARTLVMDGKPTTIHSEDGKDWFILTKK